jgi:hypothetical protein
VALREGDAVRVVGLRGPAVEHLIVANSPRAPRLGDVGVIIDVQAQGEETHYIVESDDGDGEILWLASFIAEEIELEAKFEGRGTD